MRLKRIITTLPVETTRTFKDGRVLVRPAGTVQVTSPNPGLIMAFQRYGRFVPISWSGPPVDEPGGAMTLADAEDAAIAHCLANALHPVATDVRVEVGDDVDDDTIRWTDGSVVTRRFRSCYRRVPGALPAVNMPLARTQRMNEVRIKRAKKLEKSDIDLLWAQEKADVMTQDSLKTYRQKLRDLPATEQPNVDAIMTPEQLAVWEPAWPMDPTL